MMLDDYELRRKVSQFNSDGNYVIIIRHADVQDDPQLKAQLEGWRQQIEDWPQAPVREGRARERAYWALTPPSSGKPERIYYIALDKESRVIGAAAATAHDRYTQWEELGTRYARTGTGTAVVTALAADAANRSHYLNAQADVDAIDFHKQLGSTLTNESDTGANSHIAPERTRELGSIGQSVASLRLPGSEGENQSPHY
jgi:hypothetical protein